jgi:sugar phosphate isomerase/epimerase
MTAATQACTGAGLSITGLAFEPDPMEPAAIAHAVDLAALARAPYIRLRPACLDSQPYASAVDQTIRCCEAYVQAASVRGIRVVLQQHWGTIAPSATQLFNILSRFDAHAIGCIYDAGSMTIEGYEQYRIGLEVLGPYVADVHVKNARFFRSDSGVWDWEWSPLSDGLIDLRALFRALRGAGYSGWITLEDETVGPDAPSILREGRALLQQAMDES